MSDSEDSQPELTVDSHGYDNSGSDLEVYRETDDDRRPETRDGDSADEVDPRKLYRSVDVDEIRWYYRQGDGIPSTVVDKPVDDAFKYGFEIENDPTGKIESFLDDTGFIEAYKRAEKKARRDGFALLHIKVRDTNDLHEPPKNVREIQTFEPLTVEDLTNSKPEDFEDVLPEGYTDENVEVRESGIVISKKIRDERFKDPIGYIRGDGVEPTFEHHERIIHLVWRDTVDHDRDVDALGEWEGDSILMPIFHLLKGLNKGNWAVMQTVFRHSSPLHVATAPDSTSEEKFDDLNEMMANINSKSALTLPHPDFEVNVAETGEGIDPEPYFDVVFDQICAGVEMTRSVLFGTQAGVTSGSETDIKNYYNQVHRFQENRAADKFHEVVSRIASWSEQNPESSKIIPNLALGFRLSWHPIFKIDALDKAEERRTMANALTFLINGFALTPDEARSIINEEWAEMDLDFDDLTDDQIQWLEEINLSKTGSGSLEAQEVNPREGGDAKGNPQSGQNGGGMEQGQSTASEQPDSE